MTQFKRLGLCSLLSLSVVLSACSSLDGDKINYKSATRAPTLEIPPDLTQLSGDTRYALGSGPVSATGFQAAMGKSPATAAQTAASTLGDVRVVREGNQRWLVVKRPADQLWTPVTDFWTENGFALVLDDAKLGIMETDWAENRAKLPQDWIRNSLGKVFDSLYDTGERDRFRTRLERSADGSTEIYISHRGMVETYTTNNKETAQTAWQPRPSDPELEAEFLRRLMIKLGGGTAEQARQQTAAATVVAQARVVQVNNLPAAQLDDGFDRAWRRVGLSLDRTGFTVEDRDRAKGLYFVRYVAPNPDKKEPSLFSKMFSSSDKNTGPVKYQIAVRSTDKQTTVSVLDANGAPDTSANAQRIVQVLVDDLK
ncbi:outer membrane protein assembly factor BamC [Curvibacter sp. RS43]|uniref:Outer membrane protein assembly factor BamC n=1 Tax=Curvibacter microcysteis TaxID=3026419 RepID=A0ABT5MK29_9BURK|nr:MULTISPECIES: outer membrane protein assembly factor BamC [unclassified Curvibacter]MDD0812796.1 outer membrane protein assembly factor BamC [Curvibacter sp. RS43]MDD0816923.1 outer membrane protein assembly factor BamC [Curvibacter sp. HBC28]